MTTLRLHKTSSARQLQSIRLDTAPVIVAEQGATYAIIDEATGKQPEGVVLKKKGDALVVEYRGETVAEIQGFYAAGQQSTFEVGATSCSEAAVITSDSHPAGSGEVVWQASEGGSASAGGGIADYLTLPVVGSALGAGAMIAALGGGDGGRGEMTGSMVAGTIVAGPALEGNGLSVKIYAADGTTLLSTTTVNANGSFAVNLGSYTGVVIIKVEDRDGGADYLDEATGQAKDLNAQLYSVGVVTSPNATTTFNVNPLTTAAYHKAMEAAGGAALNADTVNSVNGAVAKAFGLADLHREPVVTVNGETTYNSDDGVSQGELYGAVLAALSGMDANHGGDSQAAIDRLVAGITINAGSATLSQTVQSAIVNGAATAKVDQTTLSKVTTIIDTTAPVATIETVPYAMVQLEATGNAASIDYAAQVTALGSGGAFVVTWSGVDSSGSDFSIFVQKFNADGTTTNQAPVQLEAIGNASDEDRDPQVAAVGDSGEYVVTWYGRDSQGDFSVFVQKFNADGTTIDQPPVQLKAIGSATRLVDIPQITALGSSGEFVVTWYGRDSAGDYSVFVQKFNADGTTTNQATVQLEAMGNATGDDFSPQITALGSGGEFVVTWYGADSANDNSIFVQKFNTDGTTTNQAPVQLEAIGNAAGDDFSPQITAVGSGGEFVVTWYGADSANDNSIFVQKFNADGTTTNQAPVQLEAIGYAAGDDLRPQITALGSGGEFVVTWYGEDSARNESIFVQKFNADGTTTNQVPVQLDAIGNIMGSDVYPQIAALGSGGEFVVTWNGYDSKNDLSIFVQKFNADGSTARPLLFNNNDSVPVRSSEVGTAYLVKDSVVVTRLADITGAAADQWNSVSLTAANTTTAMSLAGLINGAYKLYTVDAAGNLSAASGQAVTVDTSGPSVSGVEITGATGAQNNTLNTGDVVSVTVTMSESTNVTGTPQLALNLGGSTVLANYVSGSGSNALVFQYTITNQTDANGISIDADSLSLNGGALHDALGNNAVLTHSAVADNASYLIDTTTPTANLAAATDDVGSVQGALSSGDSTDDTALVLSGSCEAGSSVNVYNGTTLLGAATVTGTSWSYTATVADGTNYQFNVKETDVAGNTSAATSNFTVIGDTTAPTANLGVVTDDVGSIQGPLNSGDRTDDTALVLSGSCEAGSSVNVYNGTTLLGAAAVTGTSWSYTASVADGTTYQFNVKETDAAGNTSAATSNFSVTGDTTGPSVSSVAITGANGIQNNTLNTGDVVSATVTLTEATLVTGTPQLALNLGGSTVMANYVSGSGTSALVFEYTITNETDANGISIDADSLSLNGGTLKDATGNNATLTHSTVADNAGYLVDTTAPTANFGAATDDVGSVQGALSSGDRTDDTALVLSGSCEAGSSVTVYNGTTLLGAATVTGTSWSYTASVADGTTYQFNVKETDAAGNTSAATSNFSVTGDTTGPSVSSVAITGANGIQNNTLNTGDVVSATVTLTEATLVTGTPQLALNLGGSTVMANYVSGSGSSALVFEYTITNETDANGISIDADSLSLNGGTLKDVAGNNATLTHSAVADNSNYLVDTTAPVATIDAMEQLEAIGTVYGDDRAPQITALGSDGAFVVTWFGLDSRGSDSSIFVQKFNADGTTTNQAPVQLDAIGNAGGWDSDPQVAAVGSAGEFVVTWSGKDSAGDYSIFVQKFNVDGTTTNHAPVQLEAMGNAAGTDDAPQIAAVGSGGEFVVTWYGRDSAGDYSVFVQKFNADGTTTNQTPVQLEAIGNAAGDDLKPQITALGSGGEFVVTWEGVDSEGDNSIFVQKFNADGTTTNQTPVQLEAIGNASGWESAPRITALGSAGEFVVTWYGVDGASDYSIFVQKFNADGTTTNQAPVELDAASLTGRDDELPQVSTVGSRGEFVVTWVGVDGDWDYSIFVQKFNADGTTTNQTPVQLEAIGNAYANDMDPQITALGSGGEFVVTWYGADSAGDESIFVQKFNADGTTTNQIPVQLEAIGNTRGGDYAPQIAALGSAGEFVVTWRGMDSEWDTSIFVQKFNADGTIVRPLLFNNNDGVPVRSSEVGTAYLVKDSVVVTSLADITGAAVDQWNSVSLTAANTITAMNLAGLIDGDYKLYTVDAVGNLSAASSQTVTIVSAVPTITNVSIANATMTVGDVVTATISVSHAVGESMSLVSGSIGGFLLSNLSKIDDSTYTAQFTVSEGGADVLAGDDIPVLLQLQDAMGVATESYSAAISQAADTIDANSPVAGTLGLVNFVDSGSRNNDAITQDADFDLSLVGNEVGSTVEYAVSTDGGQNWSPTTAAQRGLADGSYQFAAIVSDAAGNAVFSNVVGVQVDNAAPNAPGVALSNDTGSSASDKISRDGALNVSTEAGATVAYSTDGMSWTGSFTLSEGLNTVYVRQTDVAGNDSIASAAYTFTYDTTAPEATMELAGTATVQLEASGNDVAFEQNAQITALGSTGEFVVTWSGQDSLGNPSVFVQKFNADGTASGSQVLLGSIGDPMGPDDFPQITALGAGGEFVVVWEGQDSDGPDISVFVQKFTAGGAPSGNVVTLEAINTANGSDFSAQVAALVNGEYVVTWSGLDSAGDDSVFVQKFNADGTITHQTPVQLEAIGNDLGADLEPQVVAVGSVGEFVVTWQGVDSTGDASIFVQKFNADGSITNQTPVQLEAIGNATGDDMAPQITALGTAGEFVVTWYGMDSAGDDSIFVQKFNADGTITNQTPVQLEAIGNASGGDYSPQIAAVGSNGEFVVVWHGVDSDNPGDFSVFVQKFNADGTTTNHALVQLEAIGNAVGIDIAPKVTALGTSGEFVVTWFGEDSDNPADFSIFVQKFDANGTITNQTPVQLEATGNTSGFDASPSVTAVGSNGEFVVTWSGTDTSGAADSSIFVQKFNADGTIAASSFVVGSNGSVTVRSTEVGVAYLVKDTVVVNGLADITGAAGDQWNSVILAAANTPVALSAAGLSSGTYTLYTVDEAGNLSVASSNTVVIDGTAPTSSVTTATISNIENAVVQSTETGMAYLVNTSVVVTSLADITGAADSLWNSVAIGSANSDTNLAATGLADGSYVVYTTDAAGNLSAASANTVTVQTTAVDPFLGDASIVVFDLVDGVSSDHSGRQFDANTSYTIYIQVDSTSPALLVDANTAPGTWGSWTGGSNLGVDDTIVLVGNGAAVLGASNWPVSRAAVSVYTSMPVPGQPIMLSSFVWYTGQTGSSVAAGMLSTGVFWRAFGLNGNSLPLWTGKWASNPNQDNAFANVYLTAMPAGVMTSQGLA